MTRDVDPAGADTAALLQRTGLTLAGGRVVFGFGGNDGDCASLPGARGVRPGDRRRALDLHRGREGWPVAGRGLDGRRRPGRGRRGSRLGQRRQRVGVPDLPRLRRQRLGAGPVALDAAAAVLRAGTAGPSDNSRDLDMSAEPALLPGGQVLLAGKSRIAYLLNGAHLGGIGGQLASLGPLCSARHRRRAAVTGRTVYLPCLSRAVAVRATASPPGPAAAVEVRDRAAAHRSWPGDWSGRSASPDPCTASTRRPGTVRQRAAIGIPANHFPTPSVGAGLLLAPAAQPGRRVPGHRHRGRPGQHRPVGAAHPRPRVAQHRARGGPVRRRRRGHRDRQPGRADRARLAGVAPVAGPASASPGPSPGAPNARPRSTSSAAAAGLIAGSARTRLRRASPRQRPGWRCPAPRDRRYLPSRSGPPG